jgi:MFS family permease
MGVGMVVASLLALALARPGGPGWRWVWAVQAALSGLVAAAVLLGVRRSGVVERPARQRLPRLGGLRLAYGACGVGHALFATYFVASVSTSGGARGPALWAVVGGGATAGALVAGHWSDRWGRRRVLVGAQLAGALACAVVLTGGPGTAGTVVGGLLFGGLTTGLASLVPAALADALPAARVPDAFASLTVVFAVVQAVAPLAGGFLVEHGGFPVLFATAGLAFGVSAVSFGAAVRRRQDQPSAPGADSDGGTGS